MKRFLKWLGYVFGAVVVLAGAGLIWLYVASGNVLDRQYQATASSFDSVNFEPDPEEGARLVRLKGCFAGCHGKQMEGRLFFDEAFVGRMVAPNLTRVAADHTDQELERMIRQGIRTDGTSTWGMPSSMFYFLTDAELANIIHFIRTAEASDGPITEFEAGPLGRLGILMGEFEPQAHLVQEVASNIDLTAESESLAHGKRLALGNCSECHGLDLNGFPDFGTPGLAMVAAYDPVQFAALMRTGVPVGDRELDLMALVAERRFAQFTDDEISDLYQYLSWRVANTPTGL